MWVYFFIHLYFTFCSVSIGYWGAPPAPHLLPPGGAEPRGLDRGERGREAGPPPQVPAHPPAQAQDAPLLPQHRQYVRAHCAPSAARGPRARLSHPRAAGGACAGGAQQFGLSQGILSAVGHSPAVQDSDDGGVDGNGQPGTHGSALGGAAVW